MEQWRKQTPKPQVAFTIVELLIVIVVIAILATLTIVAYNSIQNGAKSSSLQSDLSQAAKQLDIYKYTNNETYPADQTAAIAAGVKASGGNTLTYTAYNTSQGANKGYCLQATINGLSYYTTAGGSMKSGVCETITNYVIDPDAASSTGNFSSVGGSSASSTNTISSDNSHNGATSYKRVATSNGQFAAIAYIPSGQFTVNVGDRVEWSLWVYSTKAGGLQPYMEGIRVSDSTYWGQGGGAATSIPANTWTKVTGSATANTQSRVTRIGAYNLAVLIGDIMWSDEYIATITPNSLPLFADGSSPNWSWNGTPNNSTSTGPAL